MRRAPRRARRTRRRAARGRARRRRRLRRRPTARTPRPRAAARAASSAKRGRDDGRVGGVAERRQGAAERRGRCDEAAASPALDRCRGLVRRPRAAPSKHRGGSVARAAGASTRARRSLVRALVPLQNAARRRGRAGSSTRAHRRPRRPVERVASDAAVHARRDVDAAAAALLRARARRAPRGRSRARTRGVPRGRRRARARGRRATRPATRRSIRARACCPASSCSDAHVDLGRASRRVERTA